MYYKLIKLTAVTEKSAEKGTTSGFHLILSLYALSLCVYRQQSAESPPPALSKHPITASMQMTQDGA